MGRSRYSTKTFRYSRVETEWSSPIFAEIAADGSVFTHSKQSYCCSSRLVGGASTGSAIATCVCCDERTRVFLQQLANLSAAATRARVLGGSNALWPLSGVITRSASGHARCRAQALSMGQTTS